MTRWILFGVAMLLLIVGVWLSGNVRAGDCNTKQVLDDYMCFQFHDCPVCETRNYGTMPPYRCAGSYEYGYSQYLMDNFSSGGDMKDEGYTYVACSETAMCDIGGSISPGDCSGTDGVCVSAPNANTDCASCSTGTIDPFEAMADLAASCDEEL